MLTIAGLDVFYGRAQVLFGVSLELAAGEVLALLGRNGAGKSTTLKAVVGLVPAAAGELRLDGRELSALAAHERARLGLGYVPEERRIFTGLTVAENLEVGRRAAPDGATAWTEERLFELFPNLAQVRHRRGAEISGGEQQMLAMARTLMGNPRVLLLDEPSEGLAPVIVEQLAQSLVALKAEGVSVLLSEQNLRFARRIADRAALIERGRIGHVGPMAEVASDDALRRAYLAP